MASMACSLSLAWVSSAQAEFCPWVYAPVCGEDGVRYSNTCWADDAGTTAREGGALIELWVTDDTLWFWSTNDAFINEAIEIANGERPSRVPNLALRRGADCSQPTSFHVDSDDMEWADMAIEICDGRIVDIESDIDYWVDTVQRYCSWDAVVVSVHDYR